MVPWRDWDEWYRVKVCSLCSFSKVLCVYSIHQPCSYTSPPLLSHLDDTAEQSKGRCIHRDMVAYSHL